jgi:hypothetical protein
MFKIYNVLEPYAILQIMSIAIFEKDAIGQILTNNKCQKNK